MMGYQAKPVAVRKPEDSIICFAQPGRTLDNGVEHRLQIGGRARDNAQDLRCRCQLLQQLISLALKQRKLVVGVGNG